MAPLNILKMSVIRRCLFHGGLLILGPGSSDSVMSLGRLWRSPGKESELNLIKRPRHSCILTDTVEKWKPLKLSWKSRTNFRTRLSLQSLCCPPALNSFPQFIQLEDWISPGKKELVRGHHSSDSSFRCRCRRPLKCDIACIMVHFPDVWSVAAGLGLQHFASHAPIPQSQRSRWDAGDVAGVWSSPAAPLELCLPRGSLAGDGGVESRSHLVRIAG